MIFLKIAVEDIENTVNDFNSNNTDISLKYDYGASNHILDIERLHAAHVAFLKLEETTSQMDGENISLETQDLIKQHLALIKATTGFTVSISQEDGSKGFLASIWDAIKNFFIAIWKFITNIFSKSNDKKTEEKFIYLKDRTEQLRNDLKSGKIKKVSIHMPKCNFPAMKMLEHKNFNVIPSEFDKCLRQLSSFVDETRKKVDEIFCEDGKIKEESLKVVNSGESESTESVESLKVIIEKSEVEFNDLLHKVADSQAQNALFAKLNIDVTLRGDNFIVSHGTTMEDYFDLKIDNLSASDLDKFDAMVDKIYSQYFTLHEKRHVLESYFKKLEFYVKQSEETIKTLNASLEKTHHNGDKERINVLKHMTILKRKQIIFGLKVGKLMLDCLVAIGDELMYVGSIPSSAFITEH